MEISKPTEQLKVMEDLNSRYFGLPNRKFPFVPKNRKEQEFIQSEINIIAESVSPMVEMFIRRSKAYPFLNIQDIEDIAQEAKLHLCYKSLPKYDAKKLNDYNKKPIKLCTFVYICLKNKITSLIISHEKNVSKHKAQSLYLQSKDMITPIEIPNTDNWYNDDKITELSISITKCPEAYFKTEQDVKLFKIVAKRNRHDPYKAIMREFECDEKEALEYYNSILTKVSKLLDGRIE